MIQYDDNTSMQGGFEEYVVDLGHGHDNSSYVYDGSDGEEDEEGWWWWSGDWRW